MHIPDAATLAHRCQSDGEFRLAARYWNGSLRVLIGEQALDFAIDDGIVRAGAEVEPGAGHISVAAPSGVWESILAPVPPPFFNDILPAAAAGLVVNAGDEIFWQYYPAVRRLVDLLRDEVNARATL